MNAIFGRDIKRVKRYFGDNLENLAKASDADLAIIQPWSLQVKCRELRDAMARIAPVPEGTVIRAPADAAAVMFPLMTNKDQEYLYVLLVNTRNVVIGQPVEIYHGSLNTSLIRVGEIFRPAVKANAAAIIVSHNHPSGDPAPSPEDVAVTRAIVEAGKLLDIDVLDHLVIGRDRFVSLKERGLGF